MNAFKSTKKVSKSSGSNVASSKEAWAICSTGAPTSLLPIYAFEEVEHAFGKPVIARVTQLRGKGAEKLKWEETSDGCAW